MDEKKGPGPPGATTVGSEDVKIKMKLDYSRVHKDASMRTLDAILDLNTFLTKPEVSILEMVQEVARFVYRQLHIKEVAIGLRSPSDRKYRYVAMQGMRQDIWAGHQDLIYVPEDFSGRTKWKGTQISKYTMVYLAEDNPYADGEEDTYHKHLMTVSKRRTPDDSIEGDYLDIHILGTNNDFLGWIEISGTWDGKLPDATTVRWLELAASILGVAITRQYAPQEHDQHQPAKRPR